MALLRLYLAGLTVLVGAIVVNLLAEAVGLATWYDFLKAVPAVGVQNALGALTLLDAFFLLGLYPALLGLFAYVGFRLQR